MKYTIVKEGKPYSVVSKELETTLDSVFFNNKHFKDLAEESAMGLSVEHKFLTQYQERALSILKSIEGDIRRGFDAIGTVGGLIEALADIRKENSRIEIILNGGNPELIKN